VTHGDDPGPLDGVGDLDHTALDILGQSLFQDILDFHQRYHLAADLDEALEPADMPEVAVGVDIAHVAGVVPAAADMHEGLFEIVEVALHHVVALDQDATVLARAAGLAGLVVLDADLDSGDRPADTAGAVELRGVGGDDRRALGGAVAFQQRDAMLGLEPIAQGVGTLVGPGQGDPQAGEIPFLRFAQVAPEEGRGADQKRGLLLPHDGADLLEIERVGVGEQGHAVVDRQPQVGGQPEDNGKKGRVDMKMSSS